jgi:hypothetical protein
MTDEAVNEVSGAIANPFGGRVEYMLIPGLLKKFGEPGFTFAPMNGNLPWVPCA